MSVDMRLFLQNTRVALSNQQYQHAAFLLDATLPFAEREPCPPACSPFDVGIGLHRGRIRASNEDCLLALQGTLPCSQEAFGLFVVCDGMGGHVNGQQAAQQAIQTIFEHIVPLLLHGHPSTHWESCLAEGLQLANRVIYLQNRVQKPSEPGGVPVTTSQIQRMGTTATAVLLFGKTASIANVGDSRTYLYRRDPQKKLQKITQDHSLVASLWERGVITEEELYTHPQRNQITRALGTQASVDVDTFVVPLCGDETLLLCSDGLWEMTRDRTIEDMLASSQADASSLACQLVQLANDGGGADNIGCILVRLQRPTSADLSARDTLLLEAITALNR